MRLWRWLLWFLDTMRRWLLWFLGISLGLTMGVMVGYVLIILAWKLFR